MDYLRYSCKGPLIHPEFNIDKNKRKINVI